MKILFLFLIFVPFFSFSQTSFFVALETNGGSDSLNTGTINSPFKTINKALSMMNSGDTCFVRSGIYHEEVIVSGKNDIVITSYNNEFVCFEGTQQITSNWIPYNGNIFQTNLSKHIWQLFVDNNQMVMARWPNANFIDSSIYNLNSWASGIVDSISGHPNGSYNGFQLVDTSKFDLGLTGLNVTGAIGIMNVGSFKSFNRQITSHNANDNFFNYNTVPNSSYRDKHHNFYLEGKLDLLDQANEWFYDTTTKTLYLYPEDGQNPNGRIIKGTDKDLGGTMRLGLYEAKLKNNSAINRIYKSGSIKERHRHRYEVNNNLKDQFERKGLIFSGMSPDNKLPEIIELKNHPWFIGVQFHPEFKSRPLAPHPLFSSFIKAAKNLK